MESVASMPSNSLLPPMLYEISLYAFERDQHLAGGLHDQNVYINPLNIVSGWTRKLKALCTAKEANHLLHITLRTSCKTLHISSS